MADNGSSSNLAIPLVGLLGIGVGAFLNGWLNERRAQKERQANFLLRQLSELYGPLLSLHKEIRARSELRLKIQQAADRLHAEELVNAGALGHAAISRATDDYLPSLLKMIRDESATFKEVLLPRYQQMVSTFREKMWLAEPETRQHFAELIEFVDVWERVLRDALPLQVIPAIGHTEENLHPFYRHLEQTHDRLQRELSGHTTRWYRTLVCNGIR